MVEPINYSGMLPQVDLSPLMAGFSARRQLQAKAQQVEYQRSATQLARDKFEADQQKDRDYLAAVEAYKADPTPQALRDLGLQYPEQAERLTKAANSYTEGQKQDLLGAGFQALGAISAGNTPQAIATLEKRRDALKNSGIDTSHTDSAIQMLRDGKTKEATAFLSYAMGGLVGADHAASVLETLGVGGKADDRRADNQRADRKIELDERRIANSERATTAAIERGDAASARAERADARAAAKAAGKDGGRKTKLPAGFILD